MARQTVPARQRVSALSEHCCNLGELLAVRTNSAAATDAQEVHRAFLYSGRIRRK